MKVNGRITRRQALAYVTALAVLPQQALLGCSAETDRSRIVALRRDQRSAERLGRAWLDSQSPQPSAAELVARICGESGCAELGADSDGMRRWIARRHRSDFERGNLVSLNGWRLSETEVALYALVAIGD